MIVSRLLSTAALALATAPAWAHPGHVAEQAGHTHWLSYGAAGAAVLLAAGGLAYWRRRSARRPR